MANSDRTTRGFAPRTEHDRTVRHIEFSTLSHEEGEPDRIARAETDDGVYCVDSWRAAERESYVTPRMVGWRLEQIDDYVAIMQETRSAVEAKKNPILGGIFDGCSIGALLRHIRNAGREVGQAALGLDTLHAAIDVIALFEVAFNQFSFSDLLRFKRLVEQARDEWFSKVVRRHGEEKARRAFEMTLALTEAYLIRGVSLLPSERTAFVEEYDPNGEENSTW